MISLVLKGSVSIHSIENLIQILFNNTICKNIPNSVLVSLTTAYFEIEYQKKLITINEGRTMRENSIFYVLYKKLFMKQTETLFYFKSLTKFIIDKNILPNIEKMCEYYIQSSMNARH